MGEKQLESIGHMRGGGELFQSRGATKGGKKRKQDSFSQIKEGFLLRRKKKSAGGVRINGRKKRMGRSSGGKAVKEGGGTNGFSKKRKDERHCNAPPQIGGHPIRPKGGIRVLGTFGAK